ncbi:TPA: hypothetical protein BOS_13943 [Bos taurus]|nr:TPA: hypothetical protein BOS_13943 [Bos taurus]
MATSVHRVHVAVLVAVLLQQLPQVRDVTGSQPERVQLRKLGIGGHPGQAGLESGEGFAQHAHPGALSGVGRVPLRLLALGRRTLGREGLLAAAPSHPRPLPLAASRAARRAQCTALLLAVGVILLRRRVVAGRHVAALGAAEGRPLGDGDRVPSLQSLQLHLLGVAHRAGGHRCVPRAPAFLPQASLAASAFRSLAEAGARLNSAGDERSGS